MVVNLVDETWKSGEKQQDNKIYTKIRGSCQTKCAVILALHGPSLKSNNSTGCV